jgi:hypothetical protein
VLREALGEALELVVAGDEVRLGVQLEQHAVAAVGARQADDLALGGRAPDALLGLGDALLAKVLDRRLHVAGGLLERLLAIHHAGAGSLAQLGDLLRCDRHGAHLLSFVETPPASAAGGV